MNFADEVYGPAKPQPSSPDINDVDVSTQMFYIPTVLTLKDICLVLVRSLMILMITILSKKIQYNLLILMTSI